ncbi:MAG: hypothetical protein ACPLSM_04515 [Thermosphaera sp.]
MACFIAPLVTGILIKTLERFFKNTAEKLKLNILSTMLLGGSMVLIAEHAWNGEVTMYPPFLTAMSNPADMAVAFNEITTVGLLMTLGIAGLWGGGLIIYYKNSNSNEKVRSRILTALPRKWC